MNVTKTQMLLFRSDNCSNPMADTPWSFGATLESDLVKCKPDEKLRVTLKMLTARALWEWIPLGGTFSLGILSDKGATLLNITVPHGNPTFEALAKDITLGAALPGFLCQFHAAQNKLSFSYQGGLSIAADFSASKHLQPLFGFSPGGIIISNGDTLTSDFPLNDTPFDSIKVHLSGVNPESGCQNGMNTAPGSIVQSCDVLAAFQVDSEPYGLLKYSNDNDMFSMIITDKAVRSLRFEYTDWNGTPLYQLTQNCLYLQFDTIKQASTLDDLLGRMAMSATGYQAS